MRSIGEVRRMKSNERRRRKLRHRSAASELTKALNRFAYGLLTAKSGDITDQQRGAVALLHPAVMAAVGEVDHQADDRARRSSRAQLIHPSLYIM